MIFPEGWYLYDPEDSGAPIADSLCRWYGPNVSDMHDDPYPFGDEAAALVKREARFDWSLYKRTRPVTHYDAQAIFDMAMARAALDPDGV